MPWPTPADYQDSIQNPKACFKDTTLKAGSVEITALGLPRVASGNFASVYKVSSGGQDFAVRCFLREVPEQRQRYECFSQYLSGFWLPALVGFEYLPEGIRAGTAWYPIVKMEWVDGLTLHTFIEQHKDNQGVLLNLAKQWRGMLAGLRGVGIAHSDLQHGNVLVTADGLLRLVDYDGMFVPPLRGQKCPELGLPNYQHPQRQADNYDESLDNFSALVIYLSLRALATDASLWQQFHNEENLLFIAEDYNNPTQSDVLKKLQRSPDEQVKYLAKQLADCCKKPIAQVGDFGTIMQHAPSANMPTVVMPRVQQPMPKSPPVSRQTTPPTTVRTTQTTSQKTTLRPIHDRWAFIRRYWISTAFAIIAIILGYNNVRLSFPPKATTGTTQPAVITTEPKIKVVQPEPTLPQNDVKPEKTVPEEPPVVEKPVKPLERVRAKDGAKMKLIPAGKFQMGSNDGDSDEKPVHTVDLDAYYIDAYEVTVGQYKTFIQATRHRAPDWSNVSKYSPTNNHPIIYVSWEDAKAYAQWGGASLPTEAQWEKAARGGLVGKKYPWGDTITHDDANYSGTGGKDKWDRTSPVGSFPANGYGLYDMAANVYEWCLDAYESDYYGRSPDHNPVNNNFTSVKRRVVRGGSWDDSCILRCASRFNGILTFRVTNVGFRCVVAED